MFDAAFLASSYSRPYSRIRFTVLLMNTTDISIVEEHATASADIVQFGKVKLLAHKLAFFNLLGFS